MSFALNSNEDEDDFTLSSNSNLASIFQDTEPTLLSNKSLIYTAPKQPFNRSQLPIVVSSSESVAAATAVTCYRLNNDKYEPLLEKIGLALISNHGRYTMILYQHKQKPMASVRITVNFSLIRNPDNFCFFYDDQRQNWAVLFDSKDSTENFLQEIDKIKSLLDQESSGIPSSVKEPLSIPSSSDRAIRNDSSNSTAVNNNPPITESKKTKIMSRIAKLGQPILPLNGAAITEESKSEQSSPEPCEPVLERANKQKKFSRPVSATRINGPPIKETNSFNDNTMALSSSPQYHPLMGCHHQQPFPIMQYVPGFSGTIGNSNHFDILLSETRTQNCEIRMHLCRLTDKLDIALQKNTDFEPQSVIKNSEISRESETITYLQKLHSQAGGQSDKLDRILEWITNQEHRPTISNTNHNSVELTELRATNEKEAGDIIQHLKIENSRLIKQWEEAIQQRNDSIQENVELKSANLSIQTLGEENAKLEALVKEKEVALKKLMSEQNIRLTASKKLEDVERVNRLKAENSQLSNVLDCVRKEKNLAEVQLEEKLVIYQSKCAEMESKLLEIRSLVVKKEELVKQLQLKNSQLERDASEWRGLADTLQSKLEVTEYSKDRAAVEEQVKVIMNKLYKQALKHFKPEESYSFQNIKASLQSVIRDVTLAVLNGEALQSTTFADVAKAENNVLEVPMDKHSANDTVSEHLVAQEVAIIAASGPLNTETESSKEELLDSNNLDSEEGNKGRSVSFLETLHNTLAAAQSHHEPTWKPDPPPPPLFDDFEDDDWFE